MPVAALADPGRDVRGVPFARDLAGYGDRPALLTDTGVVSYRELAARVDAVAGRLGTRRRLVLVAGANREETIVGYLAALAGGHPVLLVPGDRPDAVDAVAARYRPEVRVGADGRVTELAAAGYPLHPDLALLLPTSGTTGAAKLVRLSHRNLQSNAEAIAEYLDIRDTDRAVTTLPVHYCYGLSVVHSHLLRGAALILTDRSVADGELWELFRRHRATSLAGVPYTFDLLDRAGDDWMRLPHLRYLTQAGGAMAPDRVRRYAALGRRHGWRLFVMYGQTEATARIAYLPPELAETHPDSIGGPVPGGSLRLAPVAESPEPGVGELVYTGPNVMLGYAEGPADLARGRDVHELRTGDLARHLGDGRYRIVGRRSRFGKLFGLRIDLDRVEAEATGDGGGAAAAGGDGALAVVVEGEDRDTARIRARVARLCGVPAGVVRVRAVPALPRLPSGKPDYRAVRELADRPGPAADRAAGDDDSGTGPTADLVRLFADVLGDPDVTPDRTFVDLGGDSLSYVQMSVRLERALGTLPDRWPTIPIRELAAARPAPAGADGDRHGPMWRHGLAWLSARLGGSGSGGWRRGTLELAVALRAAAIVLVVGTHAGLFAAAGGAHLLLGVAGFHIARFHLTDRTRGERLRHLGRSTARVAAASAVWIGLAALLLTDGYAVVDVLLVRNLFPGAGGSDGWQFWFIEALVYLQLGVLALVAVPRLDRLERRFPFALPVAVAALGLVTRYQLVPGELATALVAGWLFALGWAAGKAAHRWQRLLVSAAVVATVPGFFGDPHREAVIVVGMLLVVWVARVPSWRPVNRVAGVLAAGSLYLYLTHWQVYPLLTDVSPLLATATAVAAGLGYAVLARRTGRLAARLVRRATRATRLRRTVPLG